MYHNGTDGYINVSSGAIRFQDNIKLLATQAGPNIDTTAASDYEIGAAGDRCMHVYSAETDRTSSCDPSSVSFYHIYTDFYTGPSLRASKDDIADFDYSDI